MPAKGQRHSEAARARISEGTKRGHRPWRGGLRVLPAHVRRLLARHEVAPQLRPLVGLALREVGILLAELEQRGPATHAQRLMLEAWWTQRVAALAAAEHALREATPAAFDRLASATAACARALASLGLTAAEAGEDEALEAYRRALRTRSDRGAGASIASGKAPTAGPWATSPAVAGSALDASGGAGPSPASVAPRASGPTGGQR